jgi:hypothetical protein
MICKNINLDGITCIKIFEVYKWQFGLKMKNEKYLNLNLNLKWQQCLHCSFYIDTRGVTHMGCRLKKFIYGLK